MKGIAISTIIALVLMVVALIILWLFFQPVIQNDTSSFIAGVSQSIYENTICKLNAGIFNLGKGLINCPSG